jgi:hypothetical protein
MKVSSGTLAFAYTLPPFWPVAGISPASYRPCRSHPDGLIHQGFASTYNHLKIQDFCLAQLPPDQVSTGRLTATEQKQPQTDNHNLNIYFDIRMMQFISFPI